MAKQKKAGRPPKTDDERAHVREIRATHEEWELWQAAAESKDTKRVTWLRKLATKAAKRIIREANP